jgi:hypothetical protein
MTRPCALIVTHSAVAHLNSLSRDVEVGVMTQGILPGLLRILQVFAMTADPECREICLAVDRLIVYITPSEFFY